MEKQENKKAKSSKLPRGVLKKAAEKLEKSYGATQMAWQRKDPIVEHEVLLQLHDINEIRLKNLEIRKKLGI